MRAAVSYDGGLDRNPLREINKVKSKENMQSVRRVYGSQQSGKTYVGKRRCLLQLEGLNEQGQGLS